jgi:hypothetical protein
VDIEGEDQGDEVVDDLPQADPTPPPIVPAAPMSGPDQAGDLGSDPAPGRRPAASGWALLAVLGIAAAVLAAGIIHADIGTIADQDWQDWALWASAIAMALVGGAVASLAWTLPTGATTALYPRVVTMLAVVAAFAAVIVVGVADEKGDEAAQDAVTSSAATEPGLEDPATDQATGPIGIDHAFDPATLTESAIPIAVRTFVSVDLNVTGRELIAAEMGCRPRDLVGTTLAGSAIGGTWVEPLVALNPPVREDGTTVARCTRVTVRLPVQAGSARPFS